ncbi:hypothetical protein ACU8V6_00475 [Vibrio alginolyticus]
MITFITRRVLYSVPVILVASFILFLGRALDVRSAREAPAGAGSDGDRPGDREVGARPSIPEQYFLWLRAMVTGDWG